MSRMDTDLFRRNNPIDVVCANRGIRLFGGAKQKTGKCPFHEDKAPSFSVNIETGQWYCHAGCGSGDVVDLCARFEGVTTVEFILKNRMSPTIISTPTQTPKAQIEKIYPYHDANGNEIYQVVRMVPKTFRQRHKSESGEWIWSMEGIERVLYHLPEVLESGRVWIVEGEKDAESLRAFGITATCNVGGAGKWLDSYTDALRGKEIVLCGDTDEAGKKHIEVVQKSIAGAVANTREVKVPNGKDVSEFIASFKNPEDAKSAVIALVESAKVFVKGVHVPIRAIWELEEIYREYIRSLDSCQLQLGNWIPTLGKSVRGLVPGEMMTIIAGTGVGKTALLQNLARHAAPLKTILFELELPEELVYERFMGVMMGWTGEETETAFRQAIEGDQMIGQYGHKKLDHVFTCTEPKISCEQLETYINRAELKIGERPRLVLLDYIQLIQAKGTSRYEKLSNVAEELKVIAKSCKVILVIASQISRPNPDSPEVGLFDAKDSGSIENSSGLVLGAWRNPKNKEELFLKVLKNTKGNAGLTVPCHFRGSSMQIVETSRVDLTGYEK